MQRLLTQKLRTPIFSFSDFPKTVFIVFSFLICNIGFITAANSSMMCNIAITGISTADATCMGSADGSIVLTATCVSCTNGDSDLRYSIDGIDFSNTTGMFTTVVNGTYTATIRDVNDITCFVQFPNIIVGAGMDTENPVPDAGEVSDWQEAQQIIASDGAANEHFGYDVAVFGNYAIVGAFADDDKGFESGSAYIFQRSGNSWVQQQKLTASDGTSDDRFGFRVAISGDYALVSGHKNDDDGTDSGSAYVFQRVGNTWVEQQKLTASDAATGDLFGFRVSISGTDLIVSAHQDDDNGSASGSVYVFELVGNSWIQQQKVTASDGVADDIFGAAIAIDGDYFVVSSRYDDDNGTDSGSAYVFQRTGGVWIEQQKIIAIDGAAGDWFGNDASISGDYVAIGTIKDDDNGIDSGSAYIFHRTGSIWTQQQKLIPLDGTSNDNFGNQIAIYNDKVIVSAFHDFINGLQNAGSAYIFHRSGSNWTEIDKLVPTNSNVWQVFGHAVSLSDDFVLIGAAQDDENGNHSGAAYFFEPILGGDLPSEVAACSYTPSSFPTATDLCDGTITATTTTIFPITTIGTTTITWTYTDAQGLFTTQNQDIQVVFNNYCSNPCPPDYANANQLGGQQNVNQIFETNGILESNQIILNNTDVIYNSGTCIELFPDFEVQLGTEFDALIDGCN